MKVGANGKRTGGCQQRFDAEVEASDEQDGVMGEVIDLQEHRRKAQRRKQRRERAGAGEQRPRRGREPEPTPRPESDGKDPEKTPKR